MWYIVAASRPVCLTVVGILVAARTRSVIVGRCGRADVVHVARPRVMPQDRKRIGKPLLRAEEYRAIAGTANRRIDQRDVAELRERPDELCIAGTQAIGGNLIQREVRTGDVTAFVPDVPRLEQQT